MTFTLVAALLFVRAADDGRTPAGTLGAFLGAVLLTQLSIALHNNWCDREADAQAKPWRWVPRGVLPARQALLGAVLLLAGGIALAATLGPPVAALVSLGTLCGWIYNAWLKRTAWSWAPFAVALPTLAVCSLAVARRLDGVPYVLYVIGAPLVLAIHLADSIGDIAGDRRTGSRGLAVRLGRKRAFLACWGGLLLAIATAALVRPFGIAAGPWLAASLVLLALAVGSSSLLPGTHRSLIFMSAVTAAVDYVAALGG